MSKLFNPKFNRGSTFAGTTTNRAQALSKAQHQKRTAMFSRGRVSALPAAVISRPMTEKKTLDVPLTLINFEAAGTMGFSLCNGIRKGTDMYERIGRKIALKSLHVQGQIISTKVAGGQAAPLFARLLVVYDRNPAGAAPAATDLIQGVGSTGTTSNTAYDSINMNNRDRFIVLRDKRYVLPPYGANGVATTIAPVNTWNPAQDLVVNEFVILKDLETVFNTDAAGVAEISTGSLYIITFGSDGSQGYAFNHTARLRYSDA